MLELLLAPILAVSLALAELRELFEHYDRMAARGEELWPGFDVSETPLLVYDGADSWLHDHPAPPPEYEAVDGVTWALRRPGRHVRANTADDVGGVITATVDASGDRPADVMASVAIHEAFHAFQDAHHADWTANEVELLTIAFDDGDALAERRIETELLRRALAATGAEKTRLARRACEHRAARTDASALAYERGLELREGLAQYVETRALGAPPEALPAEGYAAEAPRERCYLVGQAWALLLDELAEDGRGGWRARLNAETAPLDVLLRAELERSPAAEHAAPDEEARALAAVAERARADAADVQADRAAARAAFLARDGWTLTVESERPLFPNNFDPLNVRVVAPGEVLHTRWIVLGNDAGSIEVLDRHALSEASGDHPLFQGVRRVVVTGLPAEPKPQDADGALRLEGDGVTLRFTGATAAADPESRTLRISLR